ncbi:MAG: tRNA (N6-isopentenyl adenosine(37)-C2)-methylthiotransferase MiaB [Planctomycetota bacterium]|nr:MAG: tRNA (N6-isopentenyl adenosine(37)-C2)-methylthiotransferase MiaB [Planctomycetota bacterium]
MATRRYYLETFGCQMNVLDSEIAAGQLRQLGWEPTDEREQAELVLFNTCSVREKAEHKVWSRLGELARRKRRNPDLLVGVLGCMAQNHKEKLRRRAPHVDLILGPRQIGELGAALERIERERAPVVHADLTGPVDLRRDIAVRGARHTAYVTVMYGCDFRCTYCIVPSTRGREDSRPIAEIREEIERLCGDGVKEVTLLGQTVDGWGKRLPGRPHLGHLLEAVHDVDGLERLRFVTSHPSLMREPILRAVADLPKVCEYLHIPAQSGSDRILKAMRRGYTAARYREICAMAREIVGPDVAIASDFIVGFPGESEQDFEATLELVRSLRFSQAFIFKFSPRPHTPAWTLEDDVPEAVKRERNQRLLAAQQQVQTELHRALVGSRTEILVEGRSSHDPGKLTGRTRHNKIVIFEGEADRYEGQLVELEITDASPLALYGRLPGRPPLHAGSRQSVRARPEPARARPLPMARVR